MDSIYIASPTVALLVSVGMQVLKNSPIMPWISRDTGKVNAWIGGALAFLSSLGIATTFDWNAETGQFAAGFSGNAWELLHVLLHFPVQWAQQQVWYKMAIVPAETLGEIRAILRDVLLAQAPLAKPGESAQSKDTP